MPWPPAHVHRTYAPAVVQAAGGRAWQRNARRPGGPGVVRAVAAIPRASLGTRARRPDARQHPRCTKLLTTDLLPASHRLTAGLLLAYSWPTPGLLRAHYGLTPDRPHALHEAHRQAGVHAPGLGSSTCLAHTTAASAASHSSAAAAAAAAAAAIAPAAACATTAANLDHPGEQGRVDLAGGDLVRVRVRVTVTVRVR